MCSKNGCKKIIVLDGHMKATRKICKKSDCFSDPKIGCLFCEEHLNECNIHMKCSNMDLTGETFYVEEILESRFNKKLKKKEYLIKWKTYDDETWEPKENIPRVLIEQYTLYKTIQKEKFIVERALINRIKAVAVMFHDEHVIWLPECALNVNPEAYKIHIDNKYYREISCNTKKDKVRFHTRTAGILVGGYPCGTMTFVNEIFNSESISQVASILDGALIPENEVVCVTYDDACRLAKYVQNVDRKNEFKSNLPSLDLRVDKFHFKNHIDSWCKTHCDPYKSNHLNTVNTEVMEQFFSWVSKFSYMVKYMSRVRFHFFILDLIDKHNFVNNGQNPFHDPLSK